MLFCQFLARTRSPSFRSAHRDERGARDVCTHHIDLLRSLIKKALELIHHLKAL
jgi:hypothetical protein